MNETWILYQTTNLINGRIYVGVHKLADNRRSKNYLGSGDSIKAAIKKHGRENFVRVTLAEFSCAKDAYAAEAEIVNAEFVRLPSNYNICLGGLGGVTTPEMAAKISLANKGRVRTEEAKAKMSIFQKNRIRTPETLINMSIAQKGKKLSEETKAKISAAGRKRRHSEETKTKMSASSFKRRAVFIKGVYYQSISSAALELQIPHGTLTYKLKHSKEGYQYATEKAPVTISK